MSPSKKNTLKSDKEYLLKLLKEDFWCKTELEWLLFGPEHPILHEPVKDEVTGAELKTKRQLKIERTIQTISKHITISCHPINLELNANSFPRKLILPVYLAPTLNKQEYRASDILETLMSNGYPIPSNLVKTIKGRNLNQASTLLKELRKNMIYFAIHETYPPDFKPLNLPESPKKYKSGRGRPSFPNSKRFKEEVIKLHNKNVSKQEIPYREPITSYLKPDATNQGNKLKKEEYHDSYGHAYSTVYKYAVEAIEEHKKKNL